MKIPNPFRFAVSMLIMVWWKLRGYEVLATEENFTDRTFKCLSCPFYDEIFGQCKVCSCFIGAKARLNHEKCPKNRWGRLYIKRPV
jgi:hypothetical protein